jgi:hypothetical protein
MYILVLANTWLLQSGIHNCFPAHYLLVQLQCRKKFKVGINLYTHARACAHAHTGVPFIMSQNIAALSHRSPEFCGIFYDICHDQGHHVCTCRSNSEDSGVAYHTEYTDLFFFEMVEYLFGTVKVLNLLVGHKMVVFFLHNCFINCKNCL